MQTLRLSFDISRRCERSTWHTRTTTRVHTTRVKDTGVISPVIAILKRRAELVLRASRVQNAHTPVNVVFVMQAGGMLSWRGSFGRLRLDDTHLMQ